MSTYMSSLYQRKLASAQYSTMQIRASYLFSFLDLHYRRCSANNSCSRRNVHAIAYIGHLITAISWCKQVNDLIHKLNFYYAIVAAFQRRTERIVRTLPLTQRCLRPWSRPKFHLTRYFLSNRSPLHRHKERQAWENIGTWSRNFRLGDQSRIRTCESVFVWDMRYRIAEFMDILHVALCHY